MKQAGVVPVVRLAEDGAEAFVDALSVQVRLQPAVVLDAAVFADAQEDEPVDGALHREIDLPLIQAQVTA